MTRKFLPQEVEKTSSNIEMEVDKSHGVSQASNELESNATVFEEGIIDMSQKHGLIDVNMEPSQTSDKIVSYI